MEEKKINKKDYILKRTTDDLKNFSEEEREKLKKELSEKFPRVKADTIIIKLDDSKSS